MLDVMDLDDPARLLTQGDRDGAISVLRRAAEDGRLAPDELDRRLQRVRDAHVLGQLREVLAGLESVREEGRLWPTESPGRAAPRPAPRPVVHEPPSLPQPAGYRPDDRLTIGGGAAEDKRKGEWSIPPFLRLLPRVGSIKLDCRAAEPESEVIDVEVGIGVGSIVLVLPPGWAVNADRLGKGIGSVKVTVPTRAEPGSPTFFLHGSVGVGSLTARHANWFERRGNAAHRDSGTP